MPNQQMVTYTLEMHKPGKIIREDIRAQSTNGEIIPKIINHRDDREMRTKSNLMHIGSVDLLC